ncbi:MAG TPA: histidine phosphatase family protein [Kofleriaceae bacterium]|nr:histidine phosphatase family protein [Kofleriaceae bacterium]
MKIYLVRHAQAVSAGPGLTDADRFLSADGRETARYVGGKLREEGIEVPSLLTSPLVRAVQTAELLAGALDYFGVIESSRALIPGCEPQVIAAELMARNADVLVVGHEPTISALAAFLIGQPSFQPFRPGQVVMIENRRAMWRLKPTGQSIEPQF